jgi:TM2 domain-containing membrane protein YozV
MSHYYVADGMVQRGPYRIQDLTGRGLRTSTLVWKPGMAQWQRADRVEELIFAGVFGPVAPAVNHSVAYAGHYPSVAPYNPVTINTNRLVAGLCGILFGGLGIHKFVLGMPKPGIIMLLLTLVGGMLTCGATAALMSVIGLVEGIVYLTRSDPDFYQLYMVQKKRWF